MPGIFLAFLSLAACGAQPYRVLVLDQGDYSGNGQVTDLAALRAAITEILPQSVEVYSEGLDLQRFPAVEHQMRTMRWLREKYRDKVFDAIVTVGPESLDFAIRYRREFGLATPIVFSGTEKYYIGRLALPPGVTGVAMVSSISDAIELARKVIPGASEVVILGDAESQSDYLLDISREFIEANVNQQINVMTGMPVSAVREAISHLGDDVVIIYLGITNDSTGQYFLPDRLLAELVTSANQPVFVTRRKFMGSGAIGGLVADSVDGARELAHIVRRVVVDREDASAIPVMYLDTRRPAFDMRVLERYRVDPERLPAASEILYQEPGLWERYAYQIVLVTAVVIVQTCLIFVLISEYRRRRRAEMKFRRSMFDLAHLNRTAALGALSASISHELNQPLAAIMSNAESMQVMLQANPPAIEEASDVLADVLKENQRASDIIRSMRALFRKGEFAPVACGLDQILQEVIRVLSWHARSKDVSISVEAGEGVSAVVADRVQLQQLVLNLLMNGIEAAQQASPPARGEVVFGYRSVDGNSVELYVRDNGPGIRRELLGRIFDAHFTTKDSGMGMGLAICRAIAEAHGSRLDVQSAAGRGARFCLILPAALPT
ncbi:hypothetical protein LLG90_05395 [Aromatoleum toluclasticum]|nr:hypothetical protein [Aromatoleum toluclasticum]